MRTLGIIALMVIFMLGCGKNPYEGFIVAVEYAGEQELLAGEGSLLAMDPSSPEEKSELISEGFSAAIFPAISHDGSLLFFQGKKESSDPWQIWVLDLKKNKTAQVTNLAEDCIHPVPLPDGTVVFSRKMQNEGMEAESLFRCAMDGSALTKLTFNQHSNQFASVLNEGRLLFTSERVYPDPGESMIMVMLPDGSKAVKYYQGLNGSYSTGKAVQDRDGFVYFIENEGSGADSGLPSGDLIRINHNRPLYSRTNLSGKLSGEVHSVSTDPDNPLLIAYRPAGEKNFAIHHFDPDSETDPGLIYRGEGHVTDPVRILAMEERPRILPSVVNPEKSTGLIMCQDIHHSMLPVHDHVTGNQVASKIQILGTDGIIGEAAVKEDGSFYLSLDADRPVRIQTVNETGEIIHGPSDWIWLRPNERRGCVGCHEDPELAPDNRIPMAVKEDPVTITAAAGSESKGGTVQ